MTSWEGATAGKSRVAYLVLVELQLASGTVRIHDGGGTIPWNGYDWIGVGEFGTISTITAGGDLTAQGVSLTLSGVPSDYRTDLLNATSRGADVNIYHGIVSEALGGFSVEPELVLAGFVDNAKLVDGADDGDPTVAITVNVITAAYYARRLTMYRRSYAHQQTLYDGDRFYEFRTDLRNPMPGASTGLQVTIGGGARIGGGGGLAVLV